MPCTIVKTGGKQYRVAEGDVIEVEARRGAGDAVTLPAVLLVDGERVVPTPSSACRLGRR